jgi:aminomethyltransferase
VVNAGGREADLAHLRANLPEARVADLADRALLALQGPAAAAVLARLAPASAELPFMGTAAMDVAGLACRVSRLGYTGEDGFEISVTAEDAERLARTLLAAEEVRPAGLGARDSLRLEAGLPLHGHDIDATTTPVEVGLAWSIPKRRRELGGFAGAETILHQLAHGIARRLVGIRPEGKAPAREGTEVQAADGHAIGRVTSGGFGPSVGGPVAMGYVETASAEPGTELGLLVRGRPLLARVAALPFVPRRYHR